MCPCAGRDGEREEGASRMGSLGRGSSRFPFQGLVLESQPISLQTFHFSGCLLVFWLVFFFHLEERKTGVFKEVGWEKQSPTPFSAPQAAGGEEVQKKRE